MRRLIILFIVVLIGKFPILANLPYRIVTPDEALTIVQRDFTNQDVNYFLAQNGEASYWSIFVDPNPMKGWQHECYMYRINKLVGQTDSIIPNIVTLQNPPEYNLEPLNNINRYGLRILEKPNIAMTANNSGVSVSDKTYAVIISGGINKNSNMERYWNDCSFIYQTLVKKYRVPKNHISVIMSDGTDPEVDMTTYEKGEYISSPLDLDFDGSPDIQYAATKENISNVISSLNGILKKDDHLFIYVIDHGGSTDYVSESYICLWNGAVLYDYELAGMLSNITAKKVNVNVVLGQCNSGGFIDNLTQLGCVVSTACTGSQSSYGCRDIPYDEFVYHWTTAINEADHLGNIRNADDNNNGSISMLEAFHYAKTNDTRVETPQYVSTPQSVGEDLAFDNIPSAVDLYIKDNDQDTGVEPNITTDKFWCSPSIWVRNQNDSIEEHENPIYTPDHLSSMIYIWVHNRGKERYNGSGKWVHTYWTQAATGITTEAWYGRELYNQTHVTGGAITPSSIPEIEPGDSALVAITWAFPLDLYMALQGSDTERHHICLIAEIRDTHIPEGYVEGHTFFNVKGNNNTAQKNVSIITTNELIVNTNVYLRNTTNSIQKYTLELVPRRLADCLFYNLAKVELNLSTRVLNAWDRGGRQFQNVQYEPSITPNKVLFVANDSKLNAISLNPGEFDKIALKFNFHSVPNTFGRKYTLDLIQRDEAGNIVGGETFVVHAPSPAVRPPIIIPRNNDDGTVTLSTNVENCTTSWKNGANEVISQEDSLTVTPTANNRDFSVSVVNAEGELMTSDISLIPTIGIKSVGPLNNVADYIDIELYSEYVSQNSIINVSSVLSGEIVINQLVEPNKRNIRIDTTSLTSGVYVILLTYDNQIIDSIKFNKI